MSETTMLGPTDNGNRYELRSPTSLPLAGAFLWNQKMMVQVRQHTTRHLLFTSMSMTS
jgi:hypothetical protein